MLGSTTETNWDDHPVSGINESVRLNPKVVKRLGLKAHEAQHSLVASHLTRLGQNA